MILEDSDDESPGDAWDSLTVVVENDGGGGDDDDQGCGCSVGTGSGGALDGLIFLAMILSSWALLRFRKAGARLEDKFVS
jgi:hypothetical protein